MHNDRWWKNHKTTNHEFLTWTSYLRQNGVLVLNMHLRMEGPLIGPVETHHPSWHIKAHRGSRQQHGRHTRHTKLPIVHNCLVYTTSLHGIPYLQIISHHTSSASIHKSQNAPARWVWVGTNHTKMGNINIPAKSHRTRTLTRTQYWPFPSLLLPKPVILLELQNNDKTMTEKHCWIGNIEVKAFSRPFSMFWTNPFLDNFRNTSSC